LGALVEQRVSALERLVGRVSIQQFRIGQFFEQCGPRLIVEQRVTSPASQQ